MCDFPVLRHFLLMRLPKVHFLFLSVTLVSSFQGAFQGNRTFYPSLKPRPEAAFANTDDASAKGIVTILNPYSRVISSNTKSLQQQRAMWASMNNIRILYRNFNEAESYDGI